MQITCTLFREVADGGSTCPPDGENFEQFLKELRAGLGPDARITVASQAGDANAKKMLVSAEVSARFCDVLCCMRACRACVRG